jgi:hypothetical protein
VSDVIWVHERYDFSRPYLTAYDVKTARQVKQFFVGNVSPHGVVWGNFYVEIDSSQFTFFLQVTPLNGSDPYRWDINGILQADDAAITTDGRGLYLITVINPNTTFPVFNTYKLSGTPSVGGRANSQHLGTATVTGGATFFFGDLSNGVSVMDPVTHTVTWAEEETYYWVSPTSAGAATINTAGLFDEGSENVGTGGVVTGSRDPSSTYLDVDLCGTVPLKDGRILLMGFNESTWVEEHNIGRGHHNFYLFEAPVSNPIAWSIYGSINVPSFGDFPMNYPAFGTHTYVEPYFFYSDYVSRFFGTECTSIVRWNTVTDEIIEFKTYDINDLGFVIHSLRGSQAQVLRQYPRDDGLTGTSAPRQYPTHGASVRQGWKNNLR